MKFKKVIKEHYYGDKLSKVTKLNPLKEGYRKSINEDANSELYKMAMLAYKNNDMDFFYNLSDDELVTLWISCKITDGNPYGAAYDDEVYDAIHDRPNCDDLFDRADMVVINKMPYDNLVNLYRNITGLDNENEFTEEQLRQYVIDAVLENPPKNEAWTHFEFTSGANPYIAKTKEDADRVKRSRGDSAKFVGNIDGIDYYKVDDSNEDRDLFAVDLEEAYGDEKHPDQDAIEQALMNIKGTTKVEFDYRPHDGVYKVPENHLIILPFCRDDKIFGDGFEYFQNRKEWKTKVLSTLRRMGWTQEDPVEDNDTYLYLVMRKKSSPNMNEGKQLNEGPGAGYTVKGTITNVHLNNVKECKFSYSDDYGDYYEVELDATATFEDIEAHSYYYGGEVGDAPISIIRCVVNAEQEPTDEDIIDALSGAKVEVVIGGGWIHSTFDGSIEASVEKGELDTYYDVLDRVLFEITEKSYVYEIDDLVTGALENDYDEDGDMEESLHEDAENLADRFADIFGVVTPEEEYNGYQINGTPICINTNARNADGESIEGVLFYTLDDYVIPSVQGGALDIQAPDFINIDGEQYGDMLQFDGKVDDAKLKSIFDELKSKVKPYDDIRA